jgi:large repetitive protein
VSIWEGGVRVPSASCAPAGGAAYDCVVSGLVNGAHHSFTARAENSVGDSLDTTAVDTNAYQQPTISNLVAEAVYTPGVTSEGVATVKLTISSDADAQSFRINDSQVEWRTGSTTEVRVDVQPGNRTITVVPISTFQPPLGGGNAGDTRTVNVTAIGKPSFTTTNPSGTPGTTTLTVNIGFNPNGAPAGMSSITYLAWSGGAAPTCSADANGDLVISGATISSVDNPVITVPESNEFYYFRACGTNSFGFAMSGVPNGVYVGFAPDPPAGVPSYTISKTAVLNGSQAVYGLTGTAPVISGAPAKSTGYFNGLGMNQSTTFALNNPNAGGSVTARFCRTNNQSFCSGEVTVGYVNAPNVVRVNFPSCYGDIFNTDDDVSVSNPANGSQSVVASAPDLNLAITYTVSWSGIYSLDPITSAPVPPC